MIFNTLKFTDICQELKKRINKIMLDTYERKEESPAEE